MKRLTIFVLIFSNLFFLTYSTAENNQNEKNDSVRSKQIPEIMVNSLLTGRFKLPYQSIRSEEIQNRAFMTNADALEELSGVTVTRDGIWASSINVRGFSESKLLMMVDGDRIQTASDIAGALSVVDLENLESVELIKGAASVLYGTGAMGGIVNFKNKTPEYTRIVKASGKISSGFHTVNNLWQNNINVIVTNTNWYLNATGSYRTAGNVTTPEGKLLNSQFNDASWGLKGGIKHGENAEFKVNYQHFEAWNTGIPGGSAFPATASVKYTAFDRDQISGEYIIKNITPNIKSISLKAYNQTVTREVENIVNPKLSILPGSRNVTSGLKAAADIYLNDYHSFTTGFDGWVRDQRTTRYRLVFAATDTTVTGEMPTPKATMTNLGAFAFYTWKPDPIYWTVNAGLRLDYIETANDTAFKELFKYKHINGTVQELTPNRTVLFKDGLNRDLAYSLHLDVNWRPAEQHEIIASFSNAYRVASLEERFKYIEQGGKLMVGNPKLNPENGLFTNLNYRFKANNFVADVNIFGNYLFDLITEKLVKYNTVSGTVVDAWQNQNVAQAFYYGGELDLKWLILKGLKLQGSVSYVVGKDAETKMALPLIPPLHGSNTLEYHIHKIGGIAYKLNWVYEIEEPVIAGVEAHRHTISDIYFFPELIQIGSINLKVNGGIKNLFNTAYSEYFSSYRGLNKLEPGRSFYVKIGMLW
jgi:hemoglobin/transferrin/lactoferrin receptor protein